MPDSMMDNLGIGAGSPEVMPEIDCVLNVCVATDHVRRSVCRFHGDHSTILGERIRQTRAGDTGIAATTCTEPVKEGFVRVYIANGPTANPRLFDGDWSTSGHCFAVLDIPATDFIRYEAAKVEWDAVQRKLLDIRDNAKRYCVCGSDHANLPASYD